MKDEGVRPIQMWDPASAGLTLAGLKHMTAEEWIARLGLERHPEGGWFRQTYRSPESLPATALPSRFPTAHPVSTAIYFLLRGSEFSALHRLKADEIWHFYDGSPLTLHVIAPDGAASSLALGPGSFQAVVPAGCWFGAVLDDASPESFALVGCTVAPGFVLEDFELADRVRLIEQYPQHRALIERFTR